MKKENLTLSENVITTSDNGLTVDCSNNFHATLMTLWRDASFIFSDYRIHDRVFLVYEVLIEYIIYIVYTGTYTENVTKTIHREVYY